jgi:hypothetical protein
MMVAIGLLNAVSLTYLGRGSVWVSAALFLLLAQSMSWLNPAVTWGALIVLTWEHMDDRAAWGSPLGIAAANRLWPLLIVSFLLLARRRVGVGAAVSFSVFTLMGLLVVPLGESMRGLSAGLGWMRVHTNISISALFNDLGVPIIITIGLGSLAFLALAFRLPPRAGYGVATLGAILLSPLAWPSYLAALSPLLNQVRLGEQLPPVRTGTQAVEVPP